ncbi:MAG: PAS domain-containing sensor histidine kinase, partial [Gammaproteobacteria bacterium]|nr:PAS domain-containing sensor histidine kinase [Gammaproteobacteria bacterium]
AVLYASGLEAGAFRDKILARLGDLERLVDDMLSYAKQGEFTLQPIAVSELLKTLRARQTEARQALLHVSEPDPLTPDQIRANPDALMSVLQNLLDNAWQADPQANVVLSIEPQDDGAVGIVCQDSGPGIPAQMRERIFDPFVTTRTSGTGLGLAIVRAVVEAHNGEVAIRPGGSGATFLLRLPALMDRQAQSEEM